MRTLRQTDPAARIALYGGAFDPVHCAHIEVARRAMEAAGLDEVVFIPAARSPLKAQGPQASDEQRVEMLRLALGDLPGFRLDLHELERGGLSYSVDTAEHFRSVRPEAELFWILGADQFEQLERWHAIESLAGRVCFLVLARPGHSLDIPQIPGLHYRLVDAPLMPESSTEIRRRCRDGAPLKGLVPEAVEAFICKHQLYSRDSTHSNA